MLLTWMAQCHQCITTWLFLKQIVDVMQIIHLMQSSEHTACTNWFLSPGQEFACTYILTVVSHLVSIATQCNVSHNRTQPWFLPFPNIPRHHCLQFSAQIDFSTPQSQFGMFVCSYILLIWSTRESCWEGRSQTQRGIRIKFHIKKNGNSYKIAAAWGCLERRWGLSFLSFLHYSFTFEMEHLGHYRSERKNKNEEDLQNM